MTKNTKEIDFEDVPAFALVRERIRAMNPSVEFVKVGRDKDADIYALRLRLTSQRQTDLCLPENLLNDLKGKSTTHRDAQLEQLIQCAIERLN